MLTKAMIPVFPLSKRLELEDEKDVESYTEPFQPYSDYNFISMWSYDTKNTIELSIFNNNLVVKFSDYLTNESFFSFIGVTNYNETIKRLLTCGGNLKLIPETEYIQSLNGGEFYAEEDVDNFDYILSLTKIATLQGGEFYDKRNLVNRFISNVKEYQVSILDLSDPKVKNDINSLVTLWNQNKNEPGDKHNNERIAINRLLDNVSHFESLQAIGLYIGNKLSAFSISEILEKGYSITHFWKADVSFPGIYALMMKETAKLLLSKGCLYLNFEQDLGIPGLRTAKSLWRPEFFLKKYKISRKK